MAKVWVQLWTAKVAGSVQVEESELAKVEGLEKVKPLVPMLVEVQEKEWKLVPSVLVKESPLFRCRGWCRSYRRRRSWLGLRSYLRCWSRGRTSITIFKNHLKSFYDSAARVTEDCVACLNDRIILTKKNFGNFLD